jgi:hypothetical protein
MLPQSMQLQSSIYQESSEGRPVETMRANDEERLFGKQRLVQRPNALPPLQ